MKNKLYIMPAGSYRTYEILKFITNNYHVINDKFFVVSTKKQVFLKDPRLLAFNNLEFYPDDFPRNRILRNIFTFWYFLKMLNEYDTIIYNSLSELNSAMKFAIILSRSLKRSIWIEHGYDLYFYKITRNNIKFKLINYMNKFIRENINTVALTISFDADIYKRIYKGNPKFLNIKLPLNPVYVNYVERLKNENNDKKVIFVGVDGRWTSKHNQICDILKKIDNREFSILLPMGFSLPWQYENFTDKQYNNRVIEKFREELKLPVQVLDKGFTPDIYFNILNSISAIIYMGGRPKELDILVFALLMNKKIYLEKNSPIEKELKKYGIVTFDVNKIKTANDIFCYNEEISNTNKKIVLDIFKENNIVKLWNQLMGVDVDEE